jgi:hypothetical protein
MGFGWSGQAIEAVLLRFQLGPGIMPDTSLDPHKSKKVTIEGGEEEEKVVVVVVVARRFYDSKG